MKEFFGYAMAFLLVVLGVTWIAQGNDFFLMKAFAPRYEQVRRQTFEQSRAYNAGMVQELDAMRFEYIKADDAHKAALASVILHRAADFDLDQPNVSPELRSFITDLRRSR